MTFIAPVSLKNIEFNINKLELYMSMELVILRELDFSRIISDFAIQKSRKLSIL